MTLYCLPDEGRYRKVSNSFGVSRAAVSHVVRRVCLIVTNVLEPKYLCLPKTKEVELQTKEFEKKHGFPQCLGAVDGKQIFIRQPSKSPTDCVNRKHYSINLQAVSDYSINYFLEFHKFLGNNLVQVEKLQHLMGVGTCSGVTDVH